jgi:TP901 family phage tail tape measure protein
MKMVNSAMTANLSAIGRVGSESDKLGVKVESLTKKQQIQEAIVKEQQDAYKEVVKQKGAASKEAEALASKLNKEEAALSNITSELEEMEKQHKIMTSPWTKMSKGLDEYGSKLSSIGGQITDIGKTGSKWITAPLVALGTVGVKSAMDYESAMDKVQGLLNATDEEMKQIEESTKKWGGTTSFTSKEVADAHSYMSLAGWDAAQQIEAMGGVLKFAEATELDLANASDLVTDSMGALKLETQDLDGYLDSLVATQSNSNTTAEEMMDAYIRSGATLSSMNFTVDETNAMLGVLADEGTKGAEAGTKLNSMFAKMINPTGQTAQAFEELNLSMANADGTMKSSDEILAEIKSKTDGLTDAEKNRYIAMIAGTENLSSMNTLLDASGGKLEDYKKMNEEANGSLDKLHKIMKDNLKGDLEQFSSGLEAAALSIGEYLIPYVRDGIQWMTDMVSKFNGLNDGTKVAILAFAGIAAAIPPVLVAVGGFISLAGATMNALSPLAAALGKNGGLFKTLGKILLRFGGPVGLAVTVIGLLVAAFKSVYQNSDTFREGIHRVGEKVTEIWGKIKEFGQGVKNLFVSGEEDEGSKILKELGIDDNSIAALIGFRDRITGLKDKLIELKDTIASQIQPALQGVMDFMSQTAQTLKTMWEENSATIIPTITNIGKIISTVFSAILSTIQFIMPAVFAVIEMVWGNIQGLIRGGLKVIDGLVKVFTGIFTGDFSRVWEGVKNIFSGGISFVWNLFQLMFYGRIIKGVGSLVRIFSGSIKGLWTKVVGFFKGMYEGATLRVMYMRDKVVSLIRRMATLAKDSVSGMVNRVKSFFKDMFISAKNRVTKLKDDVVALFNRIKSNVSDAARGMKNKVVNFFTDMKDGAKRKVTNLKDDSIAMFNRIKDRVSASAKAMKDKVTGFYDDMKDKAKEKLDDMVSGAKTLPGRIRDAIKNAKSKAVDGIKSMGNSMISKLEDVINGLIRGMNKVLKKIGVENLVSEVELPRFSTGTQRGGGSLVSNGAIAKDTFATVGDRGSGNGKGTRELVQYPNGMTGLYDNDATIFAPKGTIIYNNRQTEEIINSLPQFSTGTNPQAGSGSKNGKNKKKKGLFGTIGDVLSNTWDYIKNPGKVISAIVDNIAPDWSNLAGFGKKAAKGGFKFAKDHALDWITGIFKDNEGGQVDGSKILNRAITQTFGRYTGGINFNGGKHYGVDTAHVYDRLASPVNGKVDKIWNDYGGGNSIQIKSGELTWWFMHMSSIAKKVGDLVKVGDHLGKTGNTGNFTTGPHLHTQAMRGGVGNRFAINPMSLLKKASFATGGLINSSGMYQLAEDGYPEFVIPTDPARRTDAMKLLAYAGKTLQKNDGNLRPNSIPSPGSSGSSQEINELKEIVKNQQAQMQQTNQMLEVLMKIAEKDYVALYNEKQLARDLEPEITKRSKYNTDRDARFS